MLRGEIPFPVPGSESGTGTESKAEGGPADTPKVEAPEFNGLIE